MRFTKNIINKKIALLALLILMLPSILVSPGSSKEELLWWNDDWCFRQEICVPINTNDEHAKFQPIDLRINFDNLCWAKNETEYSVRVIFQQGKKTEELESQIYDLNYTKENYINSCNLVFLIPEEADGSEKYFVYYSDTPKASPDYTNHVDVDESYYRYEPVPGLFFESRYYKIIEDGFIVYAVTQEGEAFNEKISQQVTKLKKGSKHVMPNMGEQMVSFNFVYWWLKNGEWSHISSGSHLVSKQVFVDGGLMVKFGIISESNNGFLRSKVIYKYYYSPSDDKGIYTSVTHEVVKSPLPRGDEIDVAFAIFHCGGVKSSRINELNFGEIPPFLHFYSDEGYVVSHEIDQYPESKNWQMIIGKKDDYDIGNESWFSVDYGKTGKAYGVIFDSNNILKSGRDERDGMELQMFESNSISLPGLDGRFAYIYVMRNAFEPNEPADEELASNYIVSFNAEFFSTETGGYKRVEEQSHIYKQLICTQPNSTNDVVNGGNNGNKYDLTVYSCLSPSLIFKYFSSKLFFKYPYVLIELYQNDSLIGSCRSSRIVLTDSYTIDWKNVSLFRRARFLGLPSARYLVKIYLENLLLKEKEFIGFKIVDLQDNTSIKVFCKPEATVVLSFYDQNNDSLENVECYLIKDDVVVSSDASSYNGVCVLTAPSSFSDKYLLRSVYKGFLIKEEEISLNGLYSIFPLKKKIVFDVHDFEITFRYYDGEVPDFDVDITLTSDEMQFPVVLKPDIVDIGFFKFKNLYSSNYTLCVRYNNVEVFEKHNIDKDVTENIKLYDFVLIVKDTWNLSSDVDLSVSIINNGYGKPFVLHGRCLSNGTYSFTGVYPGEYTVKINYKNDVLEQLVKIPAEYKKTVVVFPVVFNLTLNVYDSRGNVLDGAKVVLMRNGEETHSLTSEEGKVSFEIPPGRYKMMINYSDEGAVAERYINVLNDKSLSIVTVKEPVLPLIVLLNGFVFLIGFGFLSFKKKNIFLFLGCLAIFLIVLSIVSPWWGINGYSTGDKSIDTSTKLFLSPLKMVTITSNDGVVSGYLDTLDDNFVSVMNVIIILVFLSCFLIIFNTFLRCYNQGRLEFISYTLALLVFIAVLFVFIYAMSEFSNVIVGGLSGNGDIGVLIPGEGVYETMSSSWGLGIGFYLMSIAMVILFSAGFVYRKSRKI